MAEIGDLRVWHIYQMTGKEKRSVCIPVQSVAEAREIIDKRADAQVHDERIEWNAFGFEVYEADDGTGSPGWCEWYDEDGNDYDDSDVE